MKSKKTILVFTVSMVVGIILIIIGLSLNGSTNIYITNKLDILFENPNKTNYVLEQITQEVDNISIDIDYVQYCDISIGDEFSILYDDESTEYSITNNTLRINKPSLNYSEDTITFISFDLGWAANENPYIEIVIPSEMLLENIQISCMAGEILITEVNSDNINITNDFGTIAMLDIRSDKISLHSEADNINIKNIYVDNLNVVNEYGEINADFVVSEFISIESETDDIILNEIDIAKEINIISSYGNIELSMQNQEAEHSMNINSEFGRLEINNQHLPMPTILGTGDKQINITSNTGDIELTFME